MVGGAYRDTDGYCLVFSFGSVRRLVRLRAQTCFPLGAVLKGMRSQGATGLVWLTVEGVNICVGGMMEEGERKETRERKREDRSIGCHRYGTDNSGVTGSILECFN